MKLKRLSRALLFFAAVPLAAFAAEEMEEIVVTGSLIKGTPVDAQMPVEVYSAAELQDLGAPTALEFVKSLTVSGPSTGANYYFSGAQLGGDVGFNLRGLGPDKTLTLFNGRRLGGNTTSAVANGSANTAVLPGIAISRIEILKDGAAVTYGADATGGVVNYITYDDYVGAEVTSSFKSYGHDGDWNIGFLGGMGSGDTNIMVAAEWEHRSELDTGERDIASMPYSVNPAPWSTLTNLAGWTARSSLVPGSSADAQQWGGTVGLATDFTQDSCEAVGGVYRDVFTCKYKYGSYYNLVEKTDVYRIFAQATSQVSDTMEFYARASFGRVYLPHAVGSPAQPVIRGPASNQGATYQFFVPKSNPYVPEFAARTGFDQNPLYAITDGFSPITYRAFAHGGNPVFAEAGNFGVPSEIDNKYWHIASGVTGTIMNDISYDFAITYNQQSEYGDFPDVVGYRLQEALNGFGGPNCNAPDLDPSQFGTQNPGAAGTGGCGWWNPFASSWAGQPILGLDNPNYVPGNENSAEITNWMFNKRAGENISYNTTVDFVMSGLAPLELPGGAIGWAVGTQWRSTKLRESVPDPLFNGNTPCAWPGQDPASPTSPQFTGCTPDNPGPFVFFGTDIPESLEQQQESYFFELNFPLLDNLYVIGAARYEEFTGDLSATVYKFSAKFDATENLSLRASYGDNYQAPGLGITPGEITNGVNSYTIAAGDWRGAQTITESGIEPETATVWSAGAIWQSAGFTADSDVRFIIDYWNIETENELGLLASANDVASAVFSISPAGAGGAIPLDGSALADCSHPLVNRVTFNGTCQQGVTSAANFSNISTAFGNGPGQLTSGVDLSLTYSFAAFGGDLRLGVQATNTLEFEQTATTLDGYTLNSGSDRLGNLNFATIANASSEWRTNFSANYRRDNQNLRAVVQYVSGVDDERFINADGTVNEAALVPEGRAPGTTGPFGPSYFGIFGEDWISLDLHYNIDMQWARLSASIVNVTDEDPPESRQELGYDPRIGNALGRQFEIGIRKNF